MSTPAQRPPHPPSPQQQEHAQLNGAQDQAQQVQPQAATVAQHALASDGRQAEQSEGQQAQQLDDIQAVCSKVDVKYLG